MTTKIFRVWSVDGSLSTGEGRSLFCFAAAPGLPRRRKWCGRAEHSRPAKEQEPVFSALMWSNVPQKWIICHSQPAIKVRRRRSSRCSVCRAISRVHTNEHHCKFNYASLIKKNIMHSLLCPLSHSHTMQSKNIWEESVIVFFFSINIIQLLVTLRYLDDIFF